MKKTMLTAAAASACLFTLGMAAPAAAQDCVAATSDPYELTDDQVATLYSCIEGAMVKAYTQGDNVVAKEYRNWAVSGTRPGADASHGDRLLLTFANDLAAPIYLKFAEEGVEMPVGAILAKESISIKKDSKAQVGPLFLMEKVGAEKGAETGGWFYSAVQPNGKMMGVAQSFCHDCHVLFEGKDGLAYPAEEYRVSN